MEVAIPSMTRLFAQLGLQSKPAEIGVFIADHWPLAASTPLPDAAFWNPSQSEFLRSEMAEDATWSIVIEHLDASLRRRP